MVRFLAIFSLLCTTVYSDGMIISFEETPVREPAVQIESMVENSEAISRSPPKLDDLPVYPGDANYDLDVESPCSIKGPNYFRKKQDTLDLVPQDNQNRTPFEIDSSREIKRPAFRGRDTGEPPTVTYPEKYVEEPNTFDRPGSFFDQDGSDADRYGPITPSIGRYEKTIMHTALVVFGFILFLLLFLWILRKFNRGKVHSTGTEITVLERKALSHKSILYLVKVNNKKFLIAESQLEVKAMRPVNIALEEE